MSTALRPGTCGEPGPYATHCTLSPLHDWSCYDGSDDSSWNDRAPEDWQVEAPHDCSDPACSTRVVQTLVDLGWRPTVAQLVREADR